MATSQQILDKITEAERTGATTLDLSRNDLSSIPGSLELLSKLTNLDLSDNNLSSVPESLELLSKLTNLTNLNLYNNRLSSIPESIGQLTNLTSLNLSWNDLSSVPGSLELLSKLTNLTSLYLSGNGLSSIPESIGQLTNLTTLDLSWNGLSSVPGSLELLSKLTNLTNLNLYNNRLSSIPESIGQLTNLTSLNLSANRLSSIPESIGQLTKLTYLDLRENPLDIPKEVLSNPKDTARILSYLRQLGQTPSANRPMNEAKVILVGEAKVGKTSIVKRLMGLPFDPEEKKTDGIDIHCWNLEGVQCQSSGDLDNGGDASDNGNAHTIRLNVWDLGGQEIYHATHQFFLTERTLYLLVLSARCTDVQNQLYYWLKTICALGKDAPILIVHNHHEIKPGLLDQRNLTEKYPSIAGFLETSCADATLKGINALKEAIKREIGKMSHVTDLLPLAYFTMKERLKEETKQRDYISLEGYEELCQEVNGGDTEEGKRILCLLHELGTVVSFPDDLDLQDTHVLNPEWVTGGVYSILDDGTLKEKADGILKASALRDILANAEKQYPATTHRHILEMMKRFELCFSRPGRRGEYLIPELLTPIEPVAIQRSDFDDALRFELHYDFLPRSIIPRFIVSTSDLRQTFRWRNGCVIEHGSNTALISADIEAGRIRIFVTGNEPTRRDLLSIIRDHFRRVHAAPETLQVEEMVPLHKYPDAKPIPYDYLLELEADRVETLRPQGVRENLNVRELLSGIERQRATGYNERAIREERLVPDLTQQIITSLLPLFATTSERQALLTTAFGPGHTLLSQADTSGDTWTCLTNIVAKLYNHGTIESDTPALIALLTSAKELLGTDKQAQIDHIIAQLR